jgi:hypothetical protein
MRFLENLISIFLTAGLLFSVPCYAEKKAPKTESAKTQITCAKLPNNYWQFSNGSLFIGTTASGWRSEEECKIGLTMQVDIHPELICTWNSQYYDLRNKQTGVALSQNNIGWRTITECIDYTLKTATPVMACGYENGKYYIYSTAGQKLTTGFDTIQNCNTNLDETKGIGNESKWLSYFNLFDYKVQLPLVESDKKSILPVEENGFPWKECGVAQYRYHLVKSTNGIIDDECAPDTLYSWGGIDKLAWFIKNLGNGKNWPEIFQRSLYTTQSPAATFGYGYFPIRIKIKPKTKYKFLYNVPVSTCEGLEEQGLITKEERKSMVLARLAIVGGYSFVDYIICNPNVIDSWSYGMQEHYNEIIRDYTWMITKHYYNFETYLKINGVDNFINAAIDTNIYQTDFTLQRLNYSLGLMRQMHNSELGKVNYPAGIKGTVKSHFTPKTKIYFHAK